MNKSPQWNIEHINTILAGPNQPIHAALPELSKRYPSIYQLAYASTEELCEINGIGPTRAARLHAAMQLMPPPKPPGCDLIRTSQDAINAFRPHFTVRETEKLQIITLNQRQRATQSLEMTSGSYCMTVVDPRQIFCFALRNKAAALLMAHNHPSGDPSPSEPDIRVTEKLAQIGSLIGIPILDHLIFGAPTVYSFRDNGLLVGK